MMIIFLVERTTIMVLDEREIKKTKINMNKPTWHVFFFHALLALLGKKERMNKKHVLWIKWV